jgi:hypothetical protein
MPHCDLDPVAYREWLAAVAAPAPDSREAVREFVAQRSREAFEASDPYMLPTASDVAQGTGLTRSHCNAILLGLLREGVVARRADKRGHRWMIRMS